MTATQTRRRAWLMAARPQTLPAGAAPVVLGVGLAVADGVFAPLPALAVLVGTAAGALATAILVVNNVRDMETDRRAGKRTLAVVLGYRGARLEYLGLLGVAYAVPPLLRMRGHGPVVLAPLVTLALAAAVARTVLSRSDGDALNPALERTGRLLALYALALAAGLAGPRVV